jgi:hypothetical protein
MSEERLKREGRLLEYRQEAAKLRLSLGGLRSAIRNTVDPDVPVEDINAALAQQQALEFWAAHQRLVEVLGEIRRIERDLGLRSSR